MAPSSSSPILLLRLIILLAAIHLNIIVTASGSGNGNGSSDLDPATTRRSEMEAMIEALRRQGSSLFGNAITTSDLKYHLLLSSSSSSSSSSFTIFAPKDNFLYALDLLADATAYTRTLHYHVIPHHCRSFRDLHSLPSPFLHTLLPHHSLLLAPTATLHPNSSLADALLVDGIRVSAPDLFLGPTFAVHGLDGILVTGISKYQEFDFNLDSDGLGVSFPPPPRPLPELTPVPLPPLPPLLDFWNTNNPIPTAPSPSAAEPPITGITDEFCATTTTTTSTTANNHNQEEHEGGGGGKRRKRRHKRRKKHGHHHHPRHRGPSHL